MKYEAWKTFAVFLIFCLAGSLGWAIDVCANHRKGRQEPSAYLIGPKGLLMNDGVNLGDIPLAANVNDERFKINTNYLVVIFPKKIYIKTPWLGMGYGVDLIPVKPSICAEGTTYRIVLNWVRRKGEVRPYKFDAPFPEFALTDELGYEEDVSSPYKFKPVVTGRMVNP